jgi:hypothetical protein
MCPDPDSRIAHFNILEGKTPFKQALWIAWGVVCGIFLSMDILVLPGSSLQGVPGPSTKCTQFQQGMKPRKPEIYQIYFISPPLLV